MCKGKILFHDTTCHEKVALKLAAPVESYFFLHYAHSFHILNCQFYKYCMSIAKQSIRNLTRTDVVCTSLLLAPAVQDKLQGRMTN